MLPRFVVNEVDLIQALKEKRIAGAGIDVFDEEPLALIIHFEYYPMYWQHHISVMLQKKIIKFTLMKQ